MRIDEPSDWTFVTGPVIAIKKDNKFLIVQRSKKETYSGIWEFPSGGLEFFESLEDSAIRELKEETGLIAKKIKYLGYHESLDKNLKRQIVAHDFLVTDFDGKVKLSDEHQDFRWVTIEEIKKMKLNKKINEKIGYNAIAVLKKLGLKI